VEFRILGPLQVLEGGRELQLGPAKERAVLGALLLHSGSVVSRTQLVDSVWGETAPLTAAKALNNYVSQLRKTLSQDDAELILTRPPGYVLTPAAEALDATRFQRLATAAREREQAGELEAAAAVMEEALELWRGPALAGVELEGEGRDDVARLEELRLLAQLDLVDYKLALGRHEELVPELERLVALHPLDERLRGQLILALYRSGRQAEALEAYRETRETLVEQLGIEPSAPLQRLEHAILNHDPALEAPAGTARAPATPRRSRLRSRRWRAAAVVAAAGVVAVTGAAVWTSLAESAPLRLPPDSVGLIAVGHGTSLSKLPLRSSPVGLAIGNHSLWLTTNSGELLHTDLEHRGAVPSVLSTVGPGPVAVSAGSVWVLEPDRGVVERIDSGTGRAVQAIRVGNGPSAIAPGLGAVWITNGIDGTLSRVDAATGKVGRPIPVGQEPDGVVVGGGSVWVSDAAGAVLRVQPTDNQPIGRIAAGSAPGALAFGGGSVWVANRDDGTVTRIDAESDKVIETLRVGRSADGVAVAAGSAWAISATDETLTRIDLTSNRIVHVSRLGSTPTQLTSSGNQVAVATAAAGAAHSGGTLRMIGVDPYATGDPATWWSTPGWGLLAVTNDGLLTVRRAAGPDGLQIVPDLARATPLVKDGGRSYTFQLRSGLRYSNGHPVRASDVPASIERFWKLAPFAPTPDIRLGLVGETNCVRAPRRCDLSRGIVTDDKSGTVTFRLARPNPMFERLLTLPFYDILPAGTPAQDGRPLPATGPYRIVRFVRGRLVEAERNPWFRVWSTAAQPEGNPDRIVWRLGGNDSRAIESVRRGRADYAIVEPLASLSAVSAQGRVQIENNPYPSLVYAFLNTRVPPFDNADARRALNLAVDRRIIERLTGGPLRARPTCQILPPSFPGYRPTCPYTYDPNPTGSWTAPDLPRARSLLRKSGTLGSKIDVWANSSEPIHLRIGRYITTLLNTLGYRATLHPLQPEPGHGAQIGIVGWIPDTPDASASFELLTCSTYQQASPANPNLAEYCDPRTDTEIQRAMRLEPVSPGTANALWSKIDRQIVRAAPWVPLYNLRTTDVLSTRVGNYQHNPMLGFLLDQAWLK
jgi:ABC-type transport system substrate-binding protein/DNA-binding SARP family transcriptional activator